MNTTILLDAITDLDDPFILSAWGCLDGPLEAKGRTHRSRWKMIGIAAALALLLSSFAAAMAFNADFRETVFSIFHIGQTEKVPDGQGGADEGSLEPVGGQDLDGAVKTYYFRGNGVIRLDDGMVYASQYDQEAASFYDFDENGLKALDTQRADFRYTFRGTDFHISYDYAVYNGALFLRPLADPIVNENPYKYDWNLLTPGIDEHTAWLLLPYLDQEDYSVYPLQLNVQTQEITDVLAGVSFEGVHPFAWWFSADGDWAICRDSGAEQQDPDWLCNLKTGTLAPLSELIGRPVREAYFLDETTVICQAPNGDNFDVIRYDPASGDVSVVAEKMHRSNASADGSGYREIQYHGAPGKHALLCDPDGTVRLLDLKTGSILPLEGLPSDSKFLTFESPAGKAILFAWKSPKSSETQTIRRLGVLNTETGELKLLDRENDKTREEHLVSWLANDCFTILAYDDQDLNGWHLFVYDFR